MILSKWEGQPSHRSKSQKQWQRWEPWLSAKKPRPAEKAAAAPIKGATAQINHETLFGLVLPFRVFIK